MWTRGWKDRKNQKNKELVVRLSSRNVRSYSREVSPTWLPKHELNKTTTDSHANMEGGKANEASTMDKELLATGKY